MSFTISAPPHRTRRRAFRRYPSLVFAVLACVAVGAAAPAKHRVAGPAEHRGGDPAGPAVVRTADGLVQGRTTADHRVFEGIPYAAPPVGPLRLRSPQRTEPWAGVRDATQPGSACAQVFTFPPGSPPQFRGSEDCLYLNIHIPRSPDGPLPVLVFLHGGGASGSGEAYDPRRVTGGGGVIAVTINYRLGALGFLRHPDLRDPYAGNFGVADQQAALAWVRHNIAAFGGDGRNVTLWGESGGAYGVCAQLASPSARGLFDKAIVQSGPCGNDFMTRAEAERRGRDAARDLGCAAPRSVPDCLRRVQVRDIAGLYVDRFGYSRRIADVPWFPVAGTAALPLQPLRAIRAGIAGRVPLILGGTRDEMRALLAQRQREGEPAVTAADYPRLVRDLYGPHADAVLAAYPQDAYESPGVALATVLTDEGGFQGTCRQLPFDDAAARRAPVFAYEFAEPTGRMIGEVPEGAIHGADIPYFFDSYARPRPPMPDPQRRLAETLIGHWTTFARTGAPGPGWPAYRDGRALSFSTTRIGPVDLHKQHRCAFWQATTGRGQAPSPD